MTAREILKILGEGSSFPMFLNSAYIYLAANRLSLYRSEADWAITIETFGYSYIADSACTDTWTYGSRLVNRSTVKDYVSPEAYQSYLKRHAYYEFESICPIEDGDWFDPEDYPGLLTPTATEILVGGQCIAVPTPEDIGVQGISLESPPKIQLHELCRYLSATMEPDSYFAPQKQQIYIPGELSLLLQLKEWHHPDLLNEEPVDQSETFQQLARVLETGETSYYSPTLAPNTHWSNWPEMKDL
ncbi:MAG: hypothetical protein QM758_12185 [Armatimonas sp.]